MTGQLWPMAALDGRQAGGTAPGKGKMPENRRRDGETGGRFEAGLVDNNEGGINVEVVRRDSEQEPGRRAFLPWTAVRYVELLEVPEEEDDILIGRAE